MKYHIAAFYRFVQLGTTENLAEELQVFCSAQEIKGTIILAPEGFNGTVCGSLAALDALRSLLEARFTGDTEWKLSVAQRLPFARLKIKQKPEIISLGVKGLAPDVRTGEHVDAQRWNELLAEPDTVVVDTRNSYEISLGTFPGAVDPQTRTFKQFPDFVEAELDPRKQPKVAMFCTGGIRCEKAAAYLLEQGFDHVFQLRGGILRYLEEVAPAENEWSGECFVFDERLTVNERLEPGGHPACGNCHLPVHPEELASPMFESGISCPKCYASLTPSRRRSLEERQRQNRLTQARAPSGNSVGST